MKVEILRHPIEEDWMRCKFLALNTIGKSEVALPPDEMWKYRILKSRHSPIRTLMFTIRMEIPYWVSVHFCRHKFGVEHYVRSQRNDRQGEYDRNEARQDMPVVHVMDINAEALMHMAEMRLCSQAAPETRKAMQMIVNEVVSCNPEFLEFLCPKCVLNNGCNEFKPCGLWMSWFDGKSEGDEE